MSTTLTALFGPLIQIIQLLLSLSILVLVHESGHYLAARLFKVKVEKFYLFYDVSGKALLRYRNKRNGTEYGIGWLPLGGYCKIKGMYDEQYLNTGVRQPAQIDEMRAKPAWQRIIIMIAGIVFNLIFAMMIYIGLTYQAGEYSLPSKEVTAGMMFSEVAHNIGFKDNDIILTVDGKELDVLNEDFIKQVIEADNVVVLRNNEKVNIAIPNDMMRRVIASKEGLMGIQTPFIADSVFPNTPASVAGLCKGDKLIAIDTISIADISEAQHVFSYSKGKPTQLTILRGDDSIRTMVTPDSSGRIGVGLAGLASVYPIKHTNYNFFEAIPLGIKRAYKTLFGYADNMKYVFTKEGANSMGGFISMGRLFSGGFSWQTFWTITALLSVIFAFMNFLPIPMLDGAEILFLLIELVSRRKIDEKVIVKTKFVGLVLLLILFVWANLNDVFSLF